jgi:hypothetical protein
MYTFGNTVELTAVMGLVYEGAYTGTVAVATSVQCFETQKAKICHPINIKSVVSEFSSLSNPYCKLSTSRGNLPNFAVAVAITRALEKKHRCGCWISMKIKDL